MFRQGQEGEVANSQPHPLLEGVLSEERRLLIVFGVAWIVIGFIACVFGGER